MEKPNYLLNTIYNFKFLSIKEKMVACGGKLIGNGYKYKG